MVSTAAEELYNKLRFARGMRHAQFEAQEAALELKNRGLVRWDETSEVVKPLDEATALRLLLDDEHVRVADAHNRMLAGWDQLVSLLPESVGPQTDSDGLRVLTDAGQIADKAADLHSGPRRYLRVVENGESSSWLPGDRKHAGRTSAQYRIIHQAGQLQNAGHVGDFAPRSRTRITAKMVHVDDAVALVALDRAGTSAMLVEAPAPLALLAEWFDLLWASPSTVRHQSALEVDGLSPLHREVLSLMDRSDAAIAHQTGVSVSTVRRRVKDIYDLLGVHTRFAAGTAAAKRGWL
ncbi:hypothetical protein [Umezawaea sp. Da 62-37]|uniref:helix-turn-helix transcriptional regulator n=1 Tax=Umezawaea sp. Da 62-37 TaxID=3075927 RepID=UPI0028F6D24F|nr:hypothetical protein [Umezawaea sp. Da 62-37]WNV85325.1 hypothetical protein RM788_45620 [Umezawaea sp. Da 62-37]